MASEAVMDQMTFADEDTQCQEFVSNRMARVGKMMRKCMECHRDIQEHARTAVKVEDVMRVIEGNESVPSLVQGEQTTGLFLGGWKAAMNRQFLADANVGLVVNTAGGLKELFPTFKTDKLYEALAVTALELDWQDTDTQAIGGAELDGAISAISGTLSEGRSVLVHCAQGKSRSSTVVVAYVSQVEQMSINDALRLVQSKRNMAQPNGNFMSQLQDWKAGSQEVPDRHSKDDAPKESGGSDEVSGLSARPGGGEVAC